MHAAATWLKQNGWIVTTAELGYVAKMYPTLDDTQRAEVGDAQIVAGSVEVEGYLPNSQIFAGMTAIDQRIGCDKALPAAVSRTALDRGCHGPERQVRVAGQQGSATGVRRRCQAGCCSPCARGFRS